MHLNPRTARTMTDADAAVLAHGTPDPDTNEEDTPLEEQPRQSGGLNDEVGDPEQEDDGALPGRVGGGLAGG
ncbi:hypothetical protein [Xanthomonas euvesicatoria]|uniref:Uncharacterized protein n=1 Tax=Xanthomonas euvesicatoria TaxID=456327 RepID=A0AAW3U234_XANEU|nr:hypothetical protein [Xanthomonas euvesicatoria]MBB4723153.1 hypothetical protein [Xanthomonas euvesicatoria]MBB4869747.1 hypothetical protein [Xanthomonas euvesicatoria]